MKNLILALNKNLVTFFDSNQNDITPVPKWHKIYTDTTTM